MDVMTKNYPITKILPSEYEEWLETFEAEGWHLEKVSFAGYRHRFSRRSTCKVAYCYDYQDRKDASYLSLFQDAGWELVFKSCGFYLWRMEYEGERPEAFTDPESLGSRLKRLANMYTAIFAAGIALTPTMLHNVDGRAPMSVGFMILFFLAYGLILFSIIRLTRAAGILKKGSGE